MNGWHSFFQDPAYPLLAFAVMLALSCTVCEIIVRVRDRRAAHALTIDWEGETVTLPLETYRPEDVMVGVDVSPHSGRETVVIAKRLADGRIHIIMAHERTTDDE